MERPKLTKLELRIMDVLWSRGTASIRDMQESFPENQRPDHHCHDSEHPLGHWVLLRGGSKPC